MGATILWRAAPMDRPHLGRGSYWTPSADFARWFRGWLDEQFPDLGPHVLYRAEPVLADSDVLDLGHPLRFIDSATVTSSLDLLASHGHRWVRFYERPVDGRSAAQYVSLDREPIPAERMP